MDAATAAGITSSSIFFLSTLPMLVRAWRTRDLTSYSRGNLLLATVGNLVHSVYVVSLPPGPIWAMHSFYTLVTLQMLVWHVRHAPRPALSARTRHQLELVGG